MIAIGAWFGGVWRVLRSPWLVALAYVLLLATTVPLGLLLHRAIGVGVYGQNDCFLSNGVPAKAQNRNGERALLSIRRAGGIVAGVRGDP